jgi:hypothetical protein
MLDAPALAFSCCARLARISSSLLFVRRKSENPLDDLAGPRSSLKSGALTLCAPMA